MFPILLISILLSPFSLSVQEYRVAEVTMRKHVKSVVMPTFPQDAEKRGAKGPVVMQVDVDVDGNVVKTETLQSPDASVSEAVTSAVTRWKFEPFRLASGTPIGVQGKLTFYCVLDAHGKGRVENPKQFK